VDFEWIDEGVPHHGKGLTRDISSKGMFIFSDSEPPVKGDLQVDVTFRGVTEAPTNLRLSAESLVIRVEATTRRSALRGFAILNRSYKLHDGSTSIDGGNAGFEAS
jgi:hypothetical protein